MVRGISDLKRFTIAVTDGVLGSVRDLYFVDGRRGPRVGVPPPSGRPDSWNRPRDRSA
jgi:hypothetical protein